MRRITAALAFLAVSACFSCSLTAAEIGYVEDFAWAKDRAEALKQLIPGTEEYYYYHCLHYQNTQRFDEAAGVLKTWAARHGATSGWQMMRNRQFLLTYGIQPQQTLAHLRSELNLRFDHQRERIGEKPNLPNALDPERISREALTKLAFQRPNLQGFEHSALQWLIGRQLDGKQARRLLSRLKRPDYDGLVALIIRDLGQRDSGGFGSLQIHRQLTVAQLDSLLEKVPALRNHANFVHTYIAKLRPDDDQDWQHDPKAQQAYLERLWAFASELGPVHNSLKAHVLYHRLDFDVSQGVYDKPRFLAYLKLPRNSSFINPKYLEVGDNRRYVAQIGQDFNTTLLRPIGNDEPLVRSLFLHFFQTEDKYDAYLPYVQTNYLKHLFAETKAVNGLGDPEQWASLLPPAAYQALKERIDLDFDPRNKRQFRVDEPVSLDLHVKNVEQLIVKVFHINTVSHARQTLKEVNTDIQLDGLVANHEQTIQYQSPPLRRVKRHFELPELTKPGVYVIDFIGNGRSSRAVIRKGSIQHLVRSTPIGQVVTVLTEDNEIAKDALIWFGGAEYRPNKAGHILLPYSSANAATKSYVIQHGGQAFVKQFVNLSESYSLQAALVVDREALQTRQKAELIIRPLLTVNHVPATLDLLDNASLTIISTDLDGVTSHDHVADLKLADDLETSYEFQVPSRLATIRFVLSGDVKQVTKGDAPRALSTSKQYTVNQIEKTQQIADVHLAWIDNQYSISLLGRSGEPLADRAVHVELKHQDFTQTIHVDLQTDELGSVHLGELDGITWVKSKEQSGGTVRQWTLDGDFAVVPAVVNARAGQSIRLPFVDADVSRQSLSLLETHGGQIVTDRYEHLAVKDGLLHIQDLPAGNFSLLLKKAQRAVSVHVTAGPRQSGFALGKVRHLELRDVPVTIAAASVDNDSIEIRLVNADEDTRVHVFSTRFVPAFSAYHQFAGLRAANPQYVSVGSRRSLFAEDRSIGDEYDYILRRALELKFPGNMLERPSLLLNPWALRSTDTTAQDARKGEAFGARPDPSDAAPPPPKTAPGDGKGGSDADFAALNWLAGSQVLSNLTPNDQGELSVPVDQLGGGQHIRIVVVHPNGAIQRSLSLPAGDAKRRDLRLADGLNPEAHFIQQKQIAIVPKGEAFVLKSLDSARFEAYDSLGQVFGLYETLLKDPKFQEFRFVLQWPELDDSERREKYSKYACHELNFFLMHKDPAFFAEVVAPYLASKRDKTFLDHFLVEASVEGYLEPWRHGRLNLVEQILIGRQVEAEHAMVARHVNDLVAMIPPDPNRRTFLFDTAVKRSSLAVSNSRLSRRRDVETDGLIDLSVVREAKVESKPRAPRGPSRQSIPPAAVARNRPGVQDEKTRDKFAASGEGKEKGQGGMGGGIGGGGRGNFGFAYSGKDRATVEALYRTLDKTQEWAENNYYNLPIEQQGAGLVTANPFWLDYASHQGDDPFLSEHIAEAAHNFTESMLALAVLDLPWKSGEHDVKFEQDSMRLTAKSPVIMFHEEIREPQDSDKDAAILVSQNLFRQNDRYRYEHNQRLDKYVTDEFLTHTVYGCQIVVTNPTSAPQKLTVLSQIPVGALPVAGGKSTDSSHIDLQPYNTQTIEFFFYFPAVGKYPMFPVHVAKQQTMMASAEARVLNVVESLSRVDRTSWAYISQNGDDAEVLKYLGDNNLLRVNLDKIAFRMGDREFFESVVGLLTQRHVYNRTLWSYSVEHNQPSHIRQFLNHEDGYVAKCGAYLDSPLLAIDPVERKSYQHLDYKPLVNARAHQLGARRQILNGRLHTQYHALVVIHSFRPALDDDDRMSAVYYLLLQDRVEEALSLFGDVNSNQLETKIQHDYFAAYLGFYTGEIEVSMEIAGKYVDYPVDRWRRAFVAIDSQLKEIAGGAAEVVDPESRDQQQTELADQSPSFDFKVESGRVSLNHQNIDQAVVNYYLMDIELLFSRNPFVKRFSGQFSHIKPNHSQVIKLPTKQGAKAFDLPKALDNENVLVEITAGGVTKTDAYYSNSLAVQVTDRYGQLRVADAKGQPLPKSYVKVFAQMNNGAVKFYKDGYTDLRGRFDYASLSTNDLDNVRRFSVLVMSDAHGSLVREAAPPAR